VRDEGLQARIERIMRLQSRIGVVLGTAMGVTMCAYFFTFAEVINRGMMGVLWFQIGSSLVMIALLFRLQRISLALARLWMGRRPGYREAFEALRANG